MEGLDQFKQAQKENWKHFAPLEAVTTPAAARLVQFASVAGYARAGRRLRNRSRGRHGRAAWSALEGR
jgi:hypothetical protein